MRGFVDTHRGRLGYFSAGSGHPPIVLVPETPLDHTEFGRLVPLLSHRFRVLAFDSPGHGGPYLQDASAASSTINAYAEVLAAGIEALGLDQIVVYGVYTGGSVAIRLAAVTGHSRVAGLVLTAVSCHSDDVLGLISCPVLLLSHPLDLLYEADRRLTRAVPGARQVIVRAGRSPVYWTKPETVAREITALALAVAVGLELPIMSSADFILSC